MYHTLFRAYSVHDGSIKEKESSKPSNGVMREHKVEKLIKYCCKHKGDQDIIDRAILGGVMDTYHPFLRVFFC